MPLPPEILIATRNRGKLREAQELLSGLPVRWRNLAEFPETGEVEETGATFTENASLKAQAYAAQTGLWTLADDSGLEVDALGGAPGIYSARYAGAGATDAERIALLLEELRHVDERARHARFVCAIAFADTKGDVINVSLGTCEGRIAREPRGAGGFGYDPVFIPDGYDESFGQLSSEIKAQISHRARALQSTRAFLLKNFG